MVTDSQGNVIPKIGYFYSTNKTYPHWRLYIKDSGNASSTLEIGRIFAGRYVQPTRNIKDGFQIRTIDPSRKRVTAGRQGYTNIRTQYSELEFGHTDVDEQQMDVMRGIYNEVGSHTAFVFALDPDSRPSHNTIYCEFASGLNQQQRIIRQFSLPSIVLQEKN